MRRIFLLFYVSLLFFNVLNASDFNAFRNADGKIVYLHLNGIDEVKDLLKNLETIEPDLELQTLIVSDLSIKKELSDFAQFIKRNGASLKNLHFMEHNLGSAKLKDKDLVIILKAIMDLPLKSFKWEYQNKIKNVSLLPQLVHFKKFWSQLEELSFKGTEIDKKCFFIEHLNFENLEKFNLSFTKLETKHFIKLTKKPHDFPKLEELYFDGMKISNFNEFLNYKWEAPFTNLKVLSFYNEKMKHQTYQLFLKNNLENFQNLEQFFYYSSFMPKIDYLENKGKFVYKKGVVADNNIGLDFNYINLLPQIDDIGRFIHFNENSIKSMPEFFKNNTDGSNFFFSEQDDLEFYSSNNEDSLLQEKRSLYLA